MGPGRRLWDSLCWWMEVVARWSWWAPKGCRTTGDFQLLHPQHGWLAITLGMIQRPQDFPPLKYDAGIADGGSQVPVIVLGIPTMVILHLLMPHLPGSEPFFGGVSFINQSFYKPDLDISIQIHKSSQLTLELQFDLQTMTFRIRFNSLTDFRGFRLASKSGNRFTNPKTDLQILKHNHWSCQEVLSNNNNNNNNYC